MSVIDIEALLLPVSDDAPCGEDLEYDPQFGDLSLAATPQASGGALASDGGQEAEPPKWARVADIAEEMFTRTKDLRIAMHLCNARINTDGLTGLVDGLSLLKNLLVTHWDKIHPMLDAEDNDDPTMRIASFGSLADPPPNSQRPPDTQNTVSQLRKVIMVSSRQTGSFSLHDMRIASGEVKIQGDEKAPDPALINAAFMDCDLDDMKSSADSVSLALEDLQEIDTFLTDKVGSGNSVSVTVLLNELRHMSQIYSDQLSVRGVDVEPVEEEAVEAGDVVAGAAPAVSGEIRSREDAVRMLDKIGEYFRRNEPSSPVPLLLERAKGLIAKDFMSILADLTPAGLEQAELFSQARDDSD